MRCIVFLFLLPFTWWIFSLLDVYSPQKVTTVTKEKSLALRRKIAVEPSKPPTRWMAGQKSRKAQLEKACKKLYSRERMRIFFVNARRKKKVFEQLVVDNNHQVLYCYIPKIACSNWKKVMMILSGKTFVTDPSDRRLRNPHQPGSFYRLSKYSYKSIAMKVKSYKKFLFVRHPFERFLSAYRNKFESYGNTSNAFKLDYGPKIVQGFKMGDRIPFEAFVDYVLRESKKNRSLNEHWDIYDEMCHPCFLHYDYIGYYETLAEDAENILDLIGAPEGMRFPSQKSANTRMLIQKYFSYLSEDQIQGLYKVYGKDFFLFGYNKTIKISS